METPIRAAILPDYGEPVIISEVLLDNPGPHEVLVEMRASGVCRSDLHAVTGHLPLPVPLVLGHEGAGVVSAVGPLVTRVAPGDHVVLSWTPNCGVCRWCLNGQPELCERANASAVNGTLPSGAQRVVWQGQRIHTFSTTGTLADFAVVSEESVIPIPPHLPFDEAALLGCAVMTGVGSAFHSPIRPGDAVFVIGSGGVGLNIVQGAKILGAARIIVVDPSAVNRALALSLGASLVIDPKNDDPLSAVLDATRDEGVDVAFDAVGDPGLLALAFNATRRGGTAVAVGVPLPNVNVAINALAVVSQEKTLTGSWYGRSFPPRDIPRLVTLWEHGMLQLAPIIQRRYDLDHIAEAFDDIASTRGGRSVIVWS